MVKSSNGSHYIKSKPNRAQSVLTSTPVSIEVVVYEPTRQDRKGVWVVALITDLDFNLTNDDKNIKKDS